MVEEIKEQDRFKLIFNILFLILKCIIISMRIVFMDSSKITSEDALDYWLSKFSTDKIISKQEPLGEPFEKILNDNLWDLYES